MLTRDKKAIDAIKMYFSDWENITVIDLLGPEEATARKFINLYNIDIAVIDKEAAESGESGLAYEIIRKAEKQYNTERTYLLVLYDDDSVHIMIEMCKSHELVTTYTKIENERDYWMVASNLHSLINRKEMWVCHHARVIKEMNSELYANHEK